MPHSNQIKCNCSYTCLSSFAKITHLTDDLVVVRHLVVDKRQGVVARPSGVGSSQKAAVCLSFLLEQGHGFLWREGGWEGGREGGRGGGGGQRYHGVTHIRNYCI